LRFLWFTLFALPESHEKPSPERSGRAGQSRYCGVWKPPPGGQSCLESGGWQRLEIYAIL